MTFELFLKHHEMELAPKARIIDVRCKETIPPAPVILYEKNCPSSIFDSVFNKNRCKMLANQPSTVPSKEGIEKPVVSCFEDHAKLLDRESQEEKKYGLKKKDHWSEKVSNLESEKQTKTMEEESHQSPRDIVLERYCTVHPMPHG